MRSRSAGGQVAGVRYSLEAVDARGSCGCMHAPVAGKGNQPPEAVFAGGFVIGTALGYASTQADAYGSPGAMVDAVACFRPSGRTPQHQSEYFRREIGSRTGADARRTAFLRFETYRVRKGDCRLPGVPPEVDGRQGAEDSAGVVDGKFIACVGEPLAAADQCSGGRAAVFAHVEAQVLNCRDELQCRRTMGFGRFAGTQTLMLLPVVAVA